MKETEEERIQRYAMIERMMIHRRLKNLVKSRDYLDRVEAELTARLKELDELQNFGGIK